ncbi:MAG: TolC family protein [Rhodobacteraceae bacterium]|nr:TolC family protein [Paracoccaceae bacterium]
MKHQNLALITAMFALSACGAPQYSPAKLSSEVNALSKVSSDILSQPKLAKTLSGDFKNDLSKIVINSPEYILSVSNYNRSLSEILVADADRELQISASANAGQTVKDGAGLASTTERGASANLSVSQLIFDGGSSVARIDQARANAFIAEMDVALAANTTAKDAAVSWVNLDTLNKRDTRFQALMTKTEKMLTQMKTLVASGMIDKSASASAEIAARALSLEKANLDAQIAAAEASYMKFFGAVPKNLATPPSLLTAADLTHIQRNWNRAPIMAQTAAQVLSAKQSLLVAQGREKPTVGFKAGMASPMEKDERTTYAIGLEVSWIIGDGGRREANTAAQAANLKAAEQKLKGAKLAGKRELDTALSRRTALTASLDTLVAQEAASQNELEIMWSQLATGQTTVRQLIQAEEKAYRTSDQRISVASELLKIDYEMLASSGLLSKRLGINTNKTIIKAEK